MFLQPLDFAQQRARGNDDAIANETARTIGKDAGWNQVQYRLSAANKQGVTCIVAALKPDHGICIVRQKVDNLAFTFVAPLGPEDYYRSRHFSAP